MVGCTALQETRWRARFEKNLCLDLDYGPPFFKPFLSIVGGIMTCLPGFVIILFPADLECRPNHLLMVLVAGDAA